MNHPYKSGDRVNPLPKQMLQFVDGTRKVATLQLHDSRPIEEVRRMAKLIGVNLNDEWNLNISDCVVTHQEWIDI